MNYTIEVRKSYIYIKISGEISLASLYGWREIKSALEDVIASAKKNNIFKLLVDSRGFSGKISTMDRFFLAAFFVQENAKFIIGKFHPLKVAFVLDKSMIDPGKFGETVARNRGLYGLVTDNIQEALDWLELDANSEKE